MKLPFALISALILMDYAAAAPWKQPSSYVPNKASPELGHEQVQELEGYLEADQKQNTQSYPENNHGLQQQSKQRRIYYPIAVMSDKRRSSYVDHELSMDPMTTGSVEAVFKSPTESETYLRIYKESGKGMALHVGINYNTQKMSLNSYPNGGPWGEWVYPEGFPFLCCGYVTIYTLRVDIAPTAFVISVNGLELAKYPFRSELGPPVERMRFMDYSHDAELISLMVEY